MNTNTNNELELKNFEIRDGIFGNWNWMALSEPSNFEVKNNVFGNWNLFDRNPILSNEKIRAKMLIAVKERQKQIRKLNLFGHLETAVSKYIGIYDKDFQRYFKTNQKIKTEKLKIDFRPLF